MWTEDQLKAINLEGQNIIVSAGAGSGKTAVLSERVLRKVKENVHINELLILTFTKAAASEMKERIRNKLIKENLTKEVTKLDSAYITTFDSFALSVVKKYHDVINISKNVSITDEVILDLKRKEILTGIFKEEYLISNPSFLNLMKDFCDKDDKELIKLILKIHKKLEMNVKQEEYLSFYIEKHFTNEYLDEQVSNFETILLEEISLIKELIEDYALEVDGTHIEKIKEKLHTLLNAKTYDDIVRGIDYDRLPNIPKDSSDYAKQKKERISKKLSLLKEDLLWISKNEIKDELIKTKENTEVIINLLKKISEKFNHYKRDHDYYSFTDIAKLAIKIVEENKNIQEELKYKFNEILIDEYQDTSDIQEIFISLISNNNVYMVGDIKQSIYRFRNANPYLFKNKYDEYSTGSLGEKIDLMKNFRSRNEVLENINVIFDDMMDDRIGNADYKKSHQLVYGNKNYDAVKHNEQDYNMSIITYSLKEDKSYSKEEQEAFIIANDIKEKIKNNYQVIDSKTGTLRNVEYSDFVILMQRYKQFDLFKKIFEYMGIPLMLSKDSDMKEDMDIFVIKHLMRLLLKVKNSIFDDEFKYSFLSIGRSFLYRFDDEELFSHFHDQTFTKSPIYQNCLAITKEMDQLPLNEIFQKLITIFEYEEKLITIGNVEELRKRVEYFYELFSNFSKRGETIDDALLSLEELLTEETSIRIPMNDSGEDAVQIMTIFKSKGLEFPICYFADLTANFNKMELNDRIVYDEEYGIILPYIDDFIKVNILKKLMKNKLNKEDISEKLRLFYVALTRAKEKMIIVMPSVDEYDVVEKLVSDNERLNYRSFYSMMKSIFSKVEDYEEKQTNEYLTKEYLVNKKIMDLEKLKTSQTLIIENHIFTEEEQKKETFSKSNLVLHSLDEKERIKYGNLIHEQLETFDFTNKKESLLYVDEEVKDFIEYLVNSEIFQNLTNPIFYPEYEFQYKKDDINYHGIIDLLIEDDHYLVIIDYKLKNILDPQYEKQLAGYKDYIKTKTQKEVKTYLFSMLNLEYKEV